MRPALKKNSLLFNIWCGIGKWPLSTILPDKTGAIWTHRLGNVEILTCMAATEGLLMGGGAQTLSIYLEH